MRYRTKYGIEFDERMTDLDIELYAFREGLTPENGGLGKEKHFQNFAEVLFPKFLWHPWALRGLRALCRYNVVSFTGCASSSKSGLASIWGLGNFICSPHNTLIGVTTTSITKARKLIWGDMKERYMALPGLPFKLVDTPVPMIRHRDPSFSERSSISLIPAEQKKTADSIEKVVGLKNERVFLLVDEGPEMPSGIVNSLSNLDKNPFFQVVILGNAQDVFDPHGLLSTPKAGWKSITVDDEEWETERGICVHFDGFKSPNLSHKDKWPFLYTSKNLKHDIATLGENSPAFWRMVRGFWRDGGNEDVLYSASEISKAGGMRKNVVKLEGALNIAGVDPAFTSGGDRFIVYFGLLGWTEEGKLAVEFADFEHLKIDLVKNSLPDSYQYVNALKAACAARNVQPQHVGVDATGAGSTFCDLLTQEWSGAIRRIGFGEKASRLKVDPRDKKVAADLYALRVDELWGVGVRMLRDGRIYGISPDMAREMVARRFKQGEKMRVETKKEMKSRTGKSPDIADAGFIMLDVARQLGLAGGIAGNTALMEEWRKMCREADAAMTNPEMEFRHDA